MSDQCVYFIQADENGPIKIGFTADDPKRRLSQLQTGNASVLKLLGAIRGTSAHERQFHTELAEWRLQGEWFESHPTVLATIQRALSSSSEAPRAPAAFLHCSFCFKSQDDVEILVAGPAANICEECIEVCSEVVAGRKSSSAPLEQLPAQADPLIACLAARHDTDQPDRRDDSRDPQHADHGAAADPVQSHPIPQPVE